MVRNFARRGVNWTHIDYNYYLPATLRCFYVSGKCAGPENFRCSSNLCAVAFVDCIVQGRRYFIRALDDS